MQAKVSAKYLKFIVFLVIVGFAGFLAYLVVASRFGENTTVTRYMLPTKRESPPTTGLSRNNPRSQGDQTIKIDDSSVPATGESSTSSDMYQAEEHLGVEDVLGLVEHREISSDTSNLEDSSTTPQFSVEELRRRTLENRQHELWKQIQAIGREGGSIDPQDTLKVLELQEEMLRIGEELGTNRYDDGGSFDDFLRVSELMREMGRFMSSHMTKDGKLPVSKAPEMADMLEKWDADAGEKMRKVIQNAIESGDEFIQREHLKNVQ